MRISENLLSNEKWNDKSTIHEKSKFKKEKQTMLITIKEYSNF